MPTAEQDVPRDVAVPVVTFKIAMMKLVVEIAQMKAFFVAKQHAFEPGVRCDREKAVKHQVENDVDGVGCDGKVDEDRTEIEGMFNRMHRQAGPWADIAVAVVQCVEAIHDICVQKAVHPVEIKTLPDRNQKEDRDEPDRVGLECNH